MVIIATMSYPPESSKEIGERFKANKPLAGYITMKGPYLTGVRGEGIQTLTIYECERAKLTDAMEHITNRYVAYIGVPGMTYQVNVWLEAAEALKMIGL